MGDLLVSTFTPALGGGRALRTYATAAALARNGPVELVYKRFGARAPDPAFAAIEGLRLTEVAPSHGIRRALDVVRAKSGAVPLDLARAVSPELRQAVEELSPGSERIVADGLGAAITLLPLAGRRDLIYSGQNVESDLDGRLRRIERRVLRRYAETWMATDADMTRAEEVAGRVLVQRYAPNVVDVRAIVAPSPADAETGRVLYAANFGYAPNRDGLEFLVGDVMPSVWRTRPEARLTVCGSGLDLGRHDERVEALGFVDDLAEQYRRAAVVVVPLRKGGGSPLKLIEALAYAKPVVATEHAAALAEKARPGTHLLAGEGPEALAGRIAEVLDGAHPQLGDRARKLAESEYSIERLAASLER